MHQVRRSHITLRKKFRCTLPPSQHNHVLLIVVSRKIQRKTTSETSPQNQTRPEAGSSVCNLASSTSSERSFITTTTPLLLLLLSLVYGQLSGRAAAQETMLLSIRRRLLRRWIIIHNNTSFNPVPFSSVQLLLYSFLLVCCCLKLCVSCVFWLLFLSSEYWGFRVCVIVNLLPSLS